MKEVTLAEMHDKTRQCFELVERGERVRVVRNGRVIAEIVPVEQSSQPKKQSLRDFQPLTLSGKPLSEIVMEERANGY